MSTYDIETILNKWERGTITAEQAIGQVLLHMQAFSQRLGYLEKLLEFRRKQGLEMKQAEEKEERPSTIKSES